MLWSHMWLLVRLAYHLSRGHQPHLWGQDGSRTTVQQKGLPACSGVGLVPPRSRLAALTLLCCRHTEQPWASLFAFPCQKHWVTMTLLTHTGKWYICDYLDQHWVCLIGEETEQSSVTQQTQAPSHAALSRHAVRKGNRLRQLPGAEQPCLHRTSLE